LHAAYPQRYPALLESVAHDNGLGRYDLLFAHPREVLTKSHAGRLDLQGVALPGDSFLDEFARRFERERVTAQATDLPFTGGWLLLLGYEIASEIESRLALRAPLTHEPQAVALRIPAAIIYDHQHERVHLVVEEGSEALLDALERDVQTAPVRPIAGEIRITQLQEDPEEYYVEAVLRAKEYIAAGDIYQANLSRAWRAQLDSGSADDQAADLYLALRQANPAPFAASVRLESHAVLSSSPERLFSVRDGTIATRPIAGTRPRSGVPGADLGEKAGLVAHPKERAEHVMLIDLERNDLGRVCEPGSVHVDEFMALETYQHVHHIVSSVTGKLRSGTSPAQILRAIFPGGTITGCPKVRCMQIIAELETHGRGAYTGSLGYLNRDGSGDFNILIRTMSLQDGQVTLRAGAGIVADSDPQRELAETRAKARGLLRALGVNQ